MAFKKKSETAQPAAAEGPAVAAIRAQKADALKKLDRELGAARRQASAASAELSRARRTVELLSDNRKQIAETFDNLIDAAR